MTDHASRIAADHRAALVEIGWECGDVQVFGDEVGFEVVSCPVVDRKRGPVKPHRRTFSADGTMTVVRHGAV